MAAFSGIVRDLALLVSSIGYGFEQFRRVNGHGASREPSEHFETISETAEDSPRGQLVSDAVKEMAQEFAREYQLRPLGENEQRPDGYYSVDHYTGRALKKPSADTKKSWLH